MSTTSKLDTPKAKRRGLGVLAMVAATGAVACGACCVLPFALPAAALAMSGGVLAWFGGLHAWVTLAAAGAVVAGWLWVGAQVSASRRRPARSTLIVMTIATLLLALAAAWPGLELMSRAALRH